MVFCAASVLSATPLTYSLRRDDSDFVVFWQSTKFDFVINRTTAKALGLEIPLVLRVSADLID
jgi:hypothetical protein